MKFQFVEKRVSVPEEVHEYAKKKIGKLDKFFKTEGSSVITFNKEGNSSVVETTVHSGGLLYRAREKTDDYYIAIDKCVNSIENQIRRYKTRLAKSLHQNVFVREVPPVQAESEVDEELTFDVIRKKRFSVKPMTVEEAILQMNLLSHEFFLFKNFEDGNAFSIVYRRSGGGYGLITGE